MIDYENLSKSNYEFRNEFISSFEAFIDSGWFVLGTSVSVFEDEFADYHDMNACVGVASGLDALILALDALDLPERSEVIVPSNTYIATINAVVRAGLRPVLVEPDIGSYNIDPNLIEDRISSKTSVILPVHLYGKSCDMTSIMSLAKKYRLKVVEDCAQAHGTAHDGKMVGTFGDASAFSFYPTKNLGALGDAGAVLSNDERLAEKIKMLRNYGSEKKYHNAEIGYNSRLDEVQALFLAIKLKKLEAINTHKIRLAEVYLNEIKAEVILPDTYENVFHIFPVRSPERDRLREYLLKHDIKTEIHYPIPPHQQRSMEGILEGSYPVSEEIHATELSLPISYCHSESEVCEVAKRINYFFA